VGCFSPWAKEKGWRRRLGPQASAAPSGAPEPRQEQGDNRLSDGLQEEFQGKVEKVETGKELPGLFN